MLSASGLTTLGALPPFLLGAQAVWVREDLQVSLGQFGVAISTFFGVAAIGALGFGRTFDRLGRRRGLMLAGALVLLGAGAMSFLVVGWWSLMACMGLLGLGNSACQTTANLSMARGLRPGRRGLGFGVKQSAVPLAIMLGGFAVPTLGAALGWRSTFVVTGSVGLLVLINALLRPAETVKTVMPSAEPLDRPPRWPLLLCGIAITFASAAANSLGTFVASWGYEVGLTATEAGLLMSAGAAGSILVRIFSGYRADQRHGRNLPVVAAQMFTGAVCLFGLAFASTTSVMLFGFFAFTVGWAWPGLLLYAAARLGRDTPAQASGVIQTGAFIGGALGPLGFGALAGAAGFQIAWVVAGMLFLVAGTLVIIARHGFAADLRQRPPREPFAYGGGQVSTDSPS